MSRDYKAHIEDILEAATKVRRYTLGLSKEAFSADERTVDAVLRNLEVIGEAAKKVPDEIRSRSPKIDWKRISGLRDILIHEYFGIDLEIIWDIVQNKLPDLESQAKALLSET
jgi:uncharacterized protein with HEPN domain